MIDIRIDPRRTEINEIKEDPIYFIEKYITLYTPHHEDSVSMELETIHRRWLDRYISEKHSCVVTSERQLGMTTTALAYILWHAMFSNDQTAHVQHVLLFSHSMRMTALMVEMLAGMYSRLPEWLKDEIPMHAQPHRDFGDMVFKFDGRTTIISPTPIEYSRDKYVGRFISLIYVDLFDRVRRRKDGRLFMEHMWKLFPDRIIMTSTGFDNSPR